MTPTFAARFACTVFVTTVVVSTAVPASGIAAGRPPRFCAAAQQLAQEYRDAEGYDLGTRAEVRVLERAVRAAASDAPRPLRASFRTLLRFYGRILSGDIEVRGDDDAATDRYGDAADRAGRASLVLARYLRDRCGILL